MRLEGLRLKAYHDIKGLATIGYGHRERGQDCPDSITVEQALEYLHQDIDIAANIIRKFVLVALNQQQFDALVCLIFNIGGGHFMESTLRKCLNTSNYRGAADQFYVWDKADGHVVHGLLVRRQAEHDLFMEGTV